MRDAFARTLYELAKADPRMFIVVADISPAGSMAQFRTEFPDRFVNVGVAEQSMIGICAGLAMRGFRPFAYTIATFSIYRPFEQVRDDLCYQQLPVTVVGIGGGVAYSTLGGTHHSQEDIAVMSALPNMSIIAPCDPLETAAATRACLQQEGPVYLRLGKAGEPALTARAMEPFVFGRLRWLKAGDDVCIVSYGPVMKLVFEAAARIEAEQGCSVAIVSAHTLKPLDRDGLAGILQRFRTVLVVEEHSEHGGLGAWARQIAWETKASAKLLSVGLRDAFIHAFGSHADLLAAHGVTVERIVEEVGREVALRR